MTSIAQIVSGEGEFKLGIKVKKLISNVNP